MEEEERYYSTIPLNVLQSGTIDQPSIAILLRGNIQSSENQEYGYEECYWQSACRCIPSDPGVDLLCMD